MTLFIAALIVSAGLLTAGLTLYLVTRRREPPQNIFRAPLEPATPRTASKPASGIPSPLRTPRKRPDEFWPDNGLTYSIHYQEDSAKPIENIFEPAGGGYGGAGATGCWGGDSSYDSGGGSDGGCGGGD